MARVGIRSRLQNGVFWVELVVRNAPSFRMAVAEHAILVSEAGRSELLNNAAEAACLSGIAYARRNLQLDEIEVTVTEVSGVCHPNDVEGFSVAAMLAFASELGRENDILHVMKYEYQVIGRS